MSIPGLRRRPRKGRIVRYWLPAQHDVKAGYPIRAVPLPDEWTDAQVEKRCRELQQALEDWREDRNQGPAQYTVDWLINRFQTDEFSHYHRLGAKSQKSYDGLLRAISTDMGFRSLCNPKEPMTGETFRRAHRRWGKPDANGKPTAPSRARHMMVMWRGLLSYAVEIGVPGSVTLRQMLSHMRFPSAAPRDVAPTRSQVRAIVEKAIEMGFRSIAVTTLAQYELMERRVSIIGKWERKQWVPGWEWESISPEWIITYFQNKRGRIRREFSLPTVQPLLCLLHLTPDGERGGAVIKCERTGKPWQEKHYTDTFRAIARAAGVPDTVWSMDMRAGGITEADGLEINSRWIQDGAGHQIPSTTERYRRAPQRNAQTVVELRQKAMATGVHVEAANECANVVTLPTGIKR